MGGAFLDHLGRQGLAHEVRHASGLGPGLVFGGSEAGDDDHGRPGLAGLELFGQFHAIHAGHLDVGEHDIKGLLTNLLQRFMGILCGGDQIAFLGENTVETLANNGVVIHNQNFTQCTHDFLR